MSESQIIMSFLDEESSTEVEIKVASDHTHDFDIDESGNGTAKKGDNNHEHIVVSYEVIPCTLDGHTHVISLPEGWVWVEEEGIE